MICFLGGELTNTDAIKTLIEYIVVHTVYESVGGHRVYPWCFWW